MNCAFDMSPGWPCGRDCPNPCIYFADSYFVVDVLGPAVRWISSDLVWWCSESSH